MNGHDSPSPEDERFGRGAEMFAAVYGDGLPLGPRGSMAFTDLMVEHLFGEIWADDTLDVRSRRLVVMGVLAAQHEFDTLGIQFRRTLETGELSPAQVRALVIHLVAYVGYPSSGGLVRVSESAIADFEAGRS